MSLLRLHNTKWNNTNSLYESLVREAIGIYGADFKYIPRTLVAEDRILGEDRLSTFNNAYPIIAYIENNNDGFQGQGALASKFGIMMDHSTEVLIGQKDWDELVGKYGTTILSNRPAEGDLLYFPMTQTLFEILFVQDDSPFYQLGQVYVYRITIEAFRYASESLNTNDPDIDIFNDLQNLEGDDVEAPHQFGDNTHFKDEAENFVFDTRDPFKGL